MCPQYPITGFILNVSHQNLLGITFLDGSMLIQAELAHSLCKCTYLILTIIFGPAHLGYFLLWVAIVNNNTANVVYPSPLACCSGLLSYHQGMSSVFPTSLLTLVWDELLCPF